MCRMIIATTLFSFHFSFLYFFRLLSLSIHCLVARHHIFLQPERGMKCFVKSSTISGSHEPPHMNQVASHAFDVQCWVCRVRANEKTSAEEFLKILSIMICLSLVDTCLKLTREQQPHSRTMCGTSAKSVTGENTQWWWRWWWWLVIMEHKCSIYKNIDRTSQWNEGNDQKFTWFASSLSLVSVMFTFFIISCPRRVDFVIFIFSAAAVLHCILAHCLTHH